MKNLIALGAGLLFGAGLYAAMMADPNKVLAFLDLAGAWDPSLALVMVGAIAVSAVGFALSRRMQASVSGQAFGWPTLSKPDLKLLGGAALFGIGWGMTGYCPGPGFAVSRRMQASFSGQAFGWPTLSRPDLKLLGGAALFGIGWGMTGYCPGPGFAALAINPAEALPYLLAMAVGMVGWDRLAARGQAG